MKITKNTIIIVLTILNVSVIAFFLLMKPPHPPHPRNPKQVVIERLELDSDQRQKFEELVKEFRQEMERLHNAIRTEKKTVYKKILDQPEQKDSLLAVLSQKLIAVDENIVDHLFEIRAMLHDNQLTAFNELVNNIDRVFGPRPPKLAPPGSQRTPRP